MLRLSLITAVATLAVAAPAAAQIGATPPPPPPPPPPTRDHDVVAPGEDLEDVLEETPDFLEETPDHDRLWFEQRPPRDFDFDK